MSKPFSRSTTATLQCLRCYSTRSLRKGSRLSPNVGKAKLKNERAAPKPQSSEIAGPPNSGDFARLYLVGKRDRIAHKTTIQSVENFISLKIAEPVRDAIEQNVLSHLEVKKPTPIQTLAVKAIRATRRTPDLRSYLLAAETGSGKTLAYLAPVMSFLKEEEKTDEWEKIKNAPIIRSVVLVPTLELVSQVHETVKKLAAGAKLSCLPVGMTKPTVNRRVDILITTPARFNIMFGSTQSDQNSKLLNCKYVVCDEADTLMDDSFAPETHKAISTVTNLDTLIFCSATIPRSFDKTMRKLFPNIQRVVTPSIHKVPRHIDFRVIEVFKPPFLNSKPLALQQALYSIHHDNTEEGNVKRVVVFVNHTDSVNEIVKNLNEKGYPAVGISGKVEKAERIQILQAFVSPARPLDENDKVKVEVLVTTDLLARGVDMNNVRNVVLYDLPYSSVDLLHRAGRTGRLNKRGRVFVFVDRKESRGWVKGLERVVRNGMPLA